MRYEWILFDADETLFHFDGFAGMQRMLTGYGVEFTERDFEEYQVVNQSLWVDYQDGRITAQQVQDHRPLAGQPVRGPASRAPSRR